MVYLFTKYQREMKYSYSIHFLSGALDLMLGVCRKFWVTSSSQKIGPFVSPRKLHLPELWYDERPKSPMESVVSISFIPRLSSEL